MTKVFISQPMLGKTTEQIRLERKSVELSDKAESHENKAAYWESKANDINLSMPESVEYYEFKLDQRAYQVSRPTMLLLDFLVMCYYQK